MNDLISRQAAIEDIRTMIPKDARFDIKWIEMWLMQLPSAEPLRHGKWEMKPDPFGFFDEIPVCSECGCTTKMREKTKYCPDCGARMDERKEE